MPELPSLDDDSVWIPPDDPAWTRSREGVYVLRRPERQLRAVDLFCGCGGFSLGMQQAGIDVIAAAESWPTAVLTYLYNLGSVGGCALAFVTDDDRDRFRRDLAKAGESNASGWIGRNNTNTDGSGCRAMVIGDITQTTGDTFRDALSAIGIRCDIDIVIGGPPCQGISSMNAKARPDDSRNNLILEFVRLADELGADTFIMENVPPLLTSKKYRPLWDEFVSHANAAGFDLTANVLDAAGYGVPQHRRRVLAVGTRGDGPPFSFPMPTHWLFGSMADGRKWEMRSPGTPRGQAAQREKRDAQLDLKLEEVTNG